MSWEFLFGYNTRIVFATTLILGVTAGVVGCYLVLRKRALLSDTISHATLPGIGLAFIASVLAGGSGRSLIVLLIGAAIFGLLGIFATMAIRASRRLRDDAALATVLSVFFGFGIVILSLLQQMEGVNSAGLKAYLYGRTASLVWDDFVVVSFVSFCTFCAVIFFHRAFEVLCFDERFAETTGLPTRTVDVILMALVVAVVISGLQSVGLLLIVSLLIIPAVAARFWTNSLPKMMFIAGVLGGLSSFIGTAISAFAERMPAGALIVLVAAAFCILSILFGSKRGFLREQWLILMERRRIDRDHLLRLLFERGERGLAPDPYRQDVATELDWSPLKLRGVLLRAVRAGEVETMLDGRLRLSPAGEREAARLVRNHRLWELYLIHYADTAPAIVDRSADRIEHVLDETLVAQLERLLEQELPQPLGSPH